MALTEYEVNDDKLYRVQTPNTKVFKSQDSDYIELEEDYTEKIATSLTIERARKKPHDSNT